MYDSEGTEEEEIRLINKEQENNTHGVLRHHFLLQMSWCREFCTEQQLFLLKSNKLHIINSFNWTVISLICSDIIATNTILDHFIIGNYKNNQKLSTQLTKNLN